MFIESLKICKGIYVLSDYLKSKIIDLFEQHGINIIIEALHHPTEFPNKNFRITQYYDNKNKQIIQIGAWLRDVYSIYALKCNIKKCVLIGKEMDGYYVDNNFNLESWVNEQNHLDIFNDITMNVSMCRETKHINKYILFLLRYLSDKYGDSYYTIKHNTVTLNTSVINEINDNYNSVYQITYLSDDDYDDLLSKNIVFLNLIDASACNTLIECIVRNTPIAINKHPAIVEYLGINYPFYYESLDEAMIKINDISIITKTYYYLKSMDKQNLTIEHFIKSIKNSTIYKNIINLYDDVVIPENDTAILENLESIGINMNCSKLIKIVEIYLNSLNEHITTAKYAETYYQTNDIKNYLQSLQILKKNSKFIKKKLESQLPIKNQEKFTNIVKKYLKIVKFNIIIIKKHVLVIKHYEITEFLNYYLESTKILISITKIIKKLIKLLYHKLF